MVCGWMFSAERLTILTIAAVRLTSALSAGGDGPGRSRSVLWGTAMTSTFTGCYPNDVISPQYQAARRYGYGQGYGYQGGPYPGRCGHERCKPASVNRRA
jgi:hypothetical protein